MAIRTLAPELVGTFRRIGSIGPIYQVLGPAEPQNGKSSAKIFLVETGEESTYPLDELLEDREPV